MTGPQREKFLHNILSNDVQGRPAGQGSLAALMDVKGHLIALLRVLVTKDAVLLFQKVHDLVADGWAGDTTHAALQLALAKKPLAAAQA